MKEILEALPIDKFLNSLIQSLSNTHPNLVVTAPPGSGKSTRVPPALLPLTTKKNSQIWVLEPRRLAAKSLATRIAEERKFTLGQEIGYRVRFENKTQPSTQIIFLTEGLFIKALLKNPTLQGVAVLIFDEFHERSLDTDLGLALAREIQKSHRNDLRITVMSATLNAKKISAYLNDCPVIETDGNLFPVEIKHLAQSLKSTGGRFDFWESLYSEVLSIVLKRLEARDNILIFLPGKKEIDTLAEKLYSHEGIRRHFKVLSLHSNLSFEDQQLALEPHNQNQRRLILATNIAETSLTVPGVQTVIDTGYERNLNPDPLLGIDKLNLEFISKHSATQRAGRAGRLGPGTVYRLWAASDEAQQLESKSPEILRLDLKSFLLSYFVWSNLAKRQKSQNVFYEAPNPIHFSHALEELSGAELIECDFQNSEPNFSSIKATSLGAEASLLPLDPIQGAALIWGLQMGFSPKTIADVFSQIAEPIFSQRQSVRNQIETLANGLLLQSPLITSLSKSEKTTLPLEALFLRALPKSLAKLRKDSKDKALLTGGRGVFIRHQNGNPIENSYKLFIALRPFEIMKEKHRVAAVEEFIPLKDETLVERVFPNAIQNLIVWHWESEKRALKVRAEKRYLGLTLETSQQIARNQITADTWTLGVATFLAALQKEFDFFIAQTQIRYGFFFQRLAYLYHQNPKLYESENIPKLFNRDYLLPSLSDFLLTHPDPQVEFLSFEGFPFLEWKNEFFSHHSQRVIEKQAPLEFKTPTGKTIQVDYPPLGDNFGNAKISVRIQEMFGQKTTPKLAWGQAKLTIELLTPGYKPIQTTQDLENFWKITYFEIRNPLKARYPKHKWPDSV